jgi:polar amino acid transport system substrate-binding protein
MRRATRCSRVAVAIAVTAALGVAAAACSSSNNSGSNSSSTTGALGSKAPLYSKLPTSIQKAGQLAVGSDIEYAPIEFYKENTTTAQGVDVDLGKAMAAKLGVKVKFIDDTDFAGIIGALKAGRFDIVMSAMSDNKDRQGQGVDFVDYFSAGSGMIVQQGNPKHIQSLDDLCGQTVAVQKGTVQQTDVLAPQQTKCQQSGKAMTILPFEKDTDALQQVKTGRAVANVEDFPVAAYNATVSGNGKDFSVVPNQVGQISPYGIAIPSNDQQLVQAMQSALKAVIADGTYAKILKRWGVEKGSLTTAQINGGT